MFSSEIVAHLGWVPRRAVKMQFGVSISMPFVRNVLLQVRRSVTTKPQGRAPRTRHCREVRRSEQRNGLHLRRGGAEYAYEILLLGAVVCGRGGRARGKVMPEGGTFEVE